MPALKKGNTPNTPPSYRDRQAFRLIELVALWKGRVTSKTIEDAFSCSRSTATRIRNDYLAACPSNLSYCDSNKGYLPSDDFQPSYCSGSLEEYAQLRSLEGAEFPVHLGHQLQRRPNPAIVRPILKAIDKRERLDISYASFTYPKDGDRIISPHSLVNDGARWHVRAWCEKNQDFRDFVLSRIQKIHETEGPAEKTESDDLAWNQTLTVSIEPDTRLSDAQRELVSLDYDMKEVEPGRYQRDYEIRQALLIYTLQNLRLDRPRERGEAQQIMLTSECQRALALYLP